MTFPGFIDFQAYKHMRMPYIECPRSNRDYILQSATCVLTVIAKCI